MAGTLTEIYRVVNPFCQFVEFDPVTLCLLEVESIDVLSYLNREAVLVTVDILSVFLDYYGGSGYAHLGINSIDCPGGDSTYSPALINALPIMIASSWLRLRV